MITQYVVLTQLALRIISPIVFSMLLFKQATKTKVYPDRFIPAVFQARLLSSLIFSTIPLTSTNSFSKNYSYLAFNFIQGYQWLIFTGIFSCLSIWAASIGARNPEHQKVYPQLRVSQWNPCLLFWNAITWMIYLAGYEIFFRGFLLFSALEFLPITASVVVNLVLYALAHFHKGWKESLLSIPFGFLLCVITVITGNIWSAFIIHTCLALSSDWFAIRIQSGISIDRNPIIRL